MQIYSPSIDYTTTLSRGFLASETSRTVITFSSGDSVEVIRRSTFFFDTCGAADLDCQSDIRSFPWLRGLMVMMMCLVMSTLGGASHGALDHVLLISSHLFSRRRLTINFKHPDYFPDEFISVLPEGFLHFTRILFQIPEDDEDEEDDDSDEDDDCSPAINPYIPECPSIDVEAPECPPSNFDHLREFGIDEVKEVELTKVTEHDSNCGAYWVHPNHSAIATGVFKPEDEEALADKKTGQLSVVGDDSPYRRGIRVGDAWRKEIAAYLLDHNHLAGVPLTLETLFPVPARSSFPDNPSKKTVMKRGSLQKYVSNKGSSEDFGPSKFSVESVQRIAVLDIRLMNLDRHSGNLLVANDSAKKMTLIPIDHGLSLPSFQELGEASFVWQDWAQASAPLSKELTLYIENLDVSEDVQILRSLGVPEESVLTNVICTEFLRIAVSKGFLLKEIGSMISRDPFSATSQRRSFLENCVERSIPKNFAIDFTGDWFSAPENLSRQLHVYELLQKFRIVVSRQLMRRKYDQSKTKKDKPKDKRSNLPASPYRKRCSLLNSRTPSKLRRLPSSQRTWRGSARAIRQ